MLESCQLLWTQNRERSITRITNRQRGFRIQGNQMARLRNLSKLPQAKLVDSQLLIGSRESDSIEYIVRSKCRAATSSDRKAATMVV